MLLVHKASLQGSSLPKPQLSSRSQVPSTLGSLKVEFPDLHPLLDLWLAVGMGPALPTTAPAADSLACFPLSLSSFPAQSILISHPYKRDREKKM